MAPFIFEGRCTRLIFEAYIEKILVPSLKQGQTLILDNASFHKGGKIQQLIKEAGCDLCYLQPYFPDLNLLSNIIGRLLNTTSQNIPTIMTEIFLNLLNSFFKIS